MKKKGKKMYQGQTGNKKGKKKNNKIKKKRNSQAIWFSLFLRSPFPTAELVAGTKLQSLGENS